MQYTIRNIPKSLDRALRAKAKAEGKSINTIAIETLSQGLGVREAHPSHADLDWFFGGATIDHACLDAIAEHDVVHPDDWK